MASAPRRTGGAAFVGLAVALTAAIVATAAVGRPGGPVGAAQLIVASLAAVAALAGLVLAVRSRGRGRVAALALASAALVLGVAQAIIGAGLLRGVAAPGQLGSASAEFAGLLLAVGLTLWPAGRIPGAERARAAVDVMAALSGLMVLVLAVLGPAASDANTVITAHPLAVTIDLLVLTAALWLAVRARLTPAVPVIALGGAGLCAAFADLLGRSLATSAVLPDVALSLTAVALAVAALAMVASGWQRGHPAAVMTGEGGHPIGAVGAVALSTIAGACAAGVLVARGPLAALDAAAISAFAALLLVRLGLALNDVSSMSRTLADHRAELALAAARDPLTRVANRATFLGVVGAEVAAGGQPRVVYVGLDRFREIVDRFGHSGGDLVLAAVSARLTGAVGDVERVARVRGDEFAIALPLAGDTAQVAGARIAELLTSDRVDVDGVAVAVAASVGVADLADLPDGAGAEALLGAAELAMGEAKAAGRGRVATYRRGMRSGAADQAALRAELREAIDARQIGVVYQPAFSLSTGEIVAVEALARWAHPGRGPIGPDEFVRLAEDAGCVAELDLVVLEVAARQFRVWADRDPTGRLALAVNISAAHLDSPDLPVRLRAVLATYGLSPRRLIVEVTESALVGDLDLAVDVLSRLRAAGIRVAVDDFGTGYSSLAYLHRFPVDILKIDRSFVERMGRDGQTMVALIVQIGRTLGLETVAEGIEDQVQLDVLRSLGCTIGQGYLLGRPLSAADVAPLLDSGADRRATGTAGGSVIRLPER